MYTVQQVVELSGVTIKTLYYYQKIGILLPNKIGENGYRYYSDKEIQQLQEIIFYKKLKFPLEEIKQLLQNDKSRLEILEKQKELVLLQQEEMGKVILAIEKEIKFEKEGAIMDKKEMFEGFEDKDKNGDFYRKTSNFSVPFTYATHISFIVFGIVLLIIGLFFPQGAALFFGGSLYIILLGIIFVVGSVATLLLNKPKKTFEEINRNELIKEETLYEKIRKGKKK